ncbi:MAG: DNA repair protein RecN [Nitrospirae bacterium RBG_16_64_22]|nr:MAG: DNA repair protein RecN [Nitrospirae bacterium RBG_16_64_22]
MLRELHIRQFALIDALEQGFAGGFTAITGETGAGKSILVDALALLLGERAVGEWIRTGADEAAVEAVFEPPEPVRKRAAARLDGALPADEPLILKRVLSRAGRNRAYLNGSPVPLSLLEEIGELLVDIHGQHAHQSLLHASHHLLFLDAFGGTAEDREAFQARFAGYRDLCRRLEEIEVRERDRAEKEDLYRFQLREIEDLKLIDGEDDKLRREAQVLTHAEKLSAGASEAHTLLAEGEPDAATLLSRSRALLKDLSAIDPRLSETAEMLEQARLLAGEAGSNLRAYLEEIEFDPERQREVQERLFQIERLKKKWGGTIADILARAETIRNALAETETAGERREALSREIDRTSADLGREAAALTSKRKKAAASLEKQIAGELEALGMPHARLTVRFSPVEGNPPWNSAGGETAEFLFSANPGEEPRPLARIASGGEISRVMLALKSLSIAASPVPVLIFDEVDAGVGGAVASAVGERLKRLSRGAQVFCVTHLPQVASLADTQLSVEKEVRKDRTVTSVRALSQTERVEEIARMLGGKSVTPVTRRHAEEMLEKGAGKA